MLPISYGASSVHLEMEKGLKGWRVQSLQTCVFAPSSDGLSIPL